ncbi:DUF5691 domain-containing protein [Monashia sp. NPDC004114]
MSGVASGTDFERWWREVGNAALVGTARRPVPGLPRLGGAGVLGRAGDPPPREEALLDAVALGATALRAGSRLEHGDPPDRSPADERPEAGRLAIQLLELVLSQPPAGPQQRSALLAHWLRTAAGAGRRVPYGLMPGLLDLATSHRDLRRLAAAVLDRRGLWLASQRDDWRWALDAAAGVDVSAEPTVPADEWARLRSTDRLAVVSSLRARDPAAARSLVMSTWSSDAARDRRAFLEALRIGLGPDDEPLLEEALDDRAQTVREVAWELLDGLPGSARADRLAARLRPLVQATGVLKRALDVRMPDEPDRAGVRDGLGKPPPRRSARGWWLEQISAGAPLEVWTEASGADPDTTARRLSDDDALAGIRRAVRARRDGEWAFALLQLRWDASLVGALPRHQRESVVLARVESSPDRPLETAALLGALDPPWSPQLSAALVARLRASKTGSFVVAHAMPHLVAGLHPTALAALESWLSQSGADRALATNLRHLLQFHSVKRSITEAFT